MLAPPIQITLTLVVLTAALTDLRAHRIPNWLTLPAVPAGVAAQAVYGDAWWHGVLGALAAFGAFFPLFAIGARGAGDVKLFTAVGAFVGIRNILTVFVLIALIGGVSAILVALQAGALGRVLRNTGAILNAMLSWRWADVRRQSDVSEPGRLKLPYGAVIAAGTLLFLWWPR